MTDDILLEIVTNTNKNVEALVNKHVGFDENDKITFTNPTDIHEMRVLIGLFYLRGALNQNLYSVKDLFYHDSSCDVFGGTMNYMRDFIFCVRWYNLMIKKPGLNAGAWIVLQH